MKALVFVAHATHVGAAPEGSDGREEPLVLVGGGGVFQVQALVVRIPGANETAIKNKEDTLVALGVGKNKRQGDFLEKMKGNFANLSSKR